ncbi:hypothetical protein M0813_28484 [Anaeramoeba flamelloides]|uniref:Uncharacterized protein n=1 Tax=Anaeramoeba flamelloides TaxID=1746091 RepID=A0ABQ8XSV1_9EUKA|nr:hypothetical protein M0813_28484 [Anaeramoeba flamelloides]
MSSKTSRGRGRGRGKKRGRGRGRGKGRGRGRGKGKKVQVSSKPPQFPQPSSFDENDLTELIAKPSYNLDLAFVHGYQGRECRSNLKLIDDTRLLYFSATLGIIYNSEEHSQSFFRIHDEQILCVDLHPNRQYAATGQRGKTGRICVWSVDTLDLIAELSCKELKGGVTSLSFSKSGKLLYALGASNHSVAVFDWEKSLALATFVPKTTKKKEKKLQILSSKEIESKFVTIGKDHIKFWTFSKQNQTVKGRDGVFGQQFRKVDLPCVTSFCSDNKIYDVTGTITGELYIWRQGKVIKSIPLRNSNSPIVTVSCNDNMSVVVAGTRNGGVYICKQMLGKRPIIKDLKPFNDHVRAVAVSPDGKTVIGASISGDIWSLTASNDFSVLLPAHGTAYSSELWGLETHPTDLEFVTTGDDKRLMIWDIETFQIKKIHKLPESSRCVTISPNGKFIAVGYENGCFEVLHYRNCKVEFKYKGRKKGISTVKFSKNSKFFAAASTDTFIDLFQVKPNGKWVHLGTMGGHTGLINGIDFSTQNDYIQSSGYENKLLYHSMENCKRENSKDAMADIEWSSWTSIFGWPVNGIFKGTSSLSDINSCHRSNDQQLLATSDIYGMISIYNYPCVSNKHKSIKFSGHYKSVSKVRFTCDDNWLISIGQNDDSIFVWKIGEN